MEKRKKKSELSSLKERKSSKKERPSLSHSSRVWNLDMGVYFVELWRGSFFGLGLSSALISGTLGLAPFFFLGVSSIGGSFLAGFGFLFAGHQFLLALRDKQKKSSWISFFVSYVSFLLAGTIPFLLSFLALFFTRNSLVMFSLFQLFLVPFFFVCGWWKPKAIPVERIQALIEIFFLFLGTGIISFLAGKFLWNPFFVL